jgi:hypothetical protein
MLLGTLLCRLVVNAHGRLLSENSSQKRYTPGIHIYCPSMYWSVAYNEDRVTRVSQDKRQEKS